MIRFTCRRHRVVAVVAALALAACSKSDKTPAPDSAAPVPPVALAQPVAKAMPGALTKPIDQYTGSELYDFVKALRYEGGHTKDRKCKDSPGCAGTKRIKVTVDAVATQDSLGAANAPQYGVIYIRATNKGDAEEARYGMRPGNEFEYYLIVTGAQGNMQWRLEQLDTTPQARKHSQVGTGAFEGCQHPWKPGAQASFKTCADTSTVSSMRGKTVRMGLALQGGDDDPMWAACAQGCCIAK